MDIKRIIREELDDFQWMKEIEPAYELKYNTVYFISTCDTGYNEHTMINKLLQLIGKEWSQDIVSDHTWFENEHIRGDNNKVVLSFRIINYDSPPLELGWDPCRHLDDIRGGRTGVGWYRGSVEITLEQFLNSVMETDNLSRDNK